MYNISIEVTKTNGNTQYFPIEKPQVVLGRSGLADVSIPDVSELELEHVLIVPQGWKGCWVSLTKESKIPAIFQGSNFNGGLIPFEKELIIGPLRIRFVHRFNKEKKSFVFPLLFLLLVLGIAVAVTIVILKKTTTLASSEGLDIPALFVKGPYDCSVTTNIQRHAKHMKYKAQSHEDRYHYDLQDGVIASKLYGEAAACFRRVGLASEAQFLEGKREKMQKILNANYAALRFQLNQALKRKQWKEASRKASVLLQMTKHLNAKQSPYIRWLKKTHRITQTKLTLP